MTPAVRFPSPRGRTSTLRAFLPKRSGLGDVPSVRAICTTASPPVRHSARRAAGIGSVTGGATPRTQTRSANARRRTTGRTGRSSSRRRRQGEAGRDPPSGRHARSVATRSRAGSASPAGPVAAGRRATAGRTRRATPHARPRRLSADAKRGERRGPHEPAPLRTKAAAEATSTQHDRPRLRARPPNAAEGA